MPEENDVGSNGLKPDETFAGKTKDFRSTKRKIKDFQKKRRMDAAEKFRKEALEKHGEYINAIIGTGSVTRDEFSSESDLDITVFIDDTREDVDKKKKKEIEKDLKEIAEGCGKTKSGNHILHVQPPWTITEYWDMMRRGSPVAHSWTQDAKAIYDDGFFGPVQRLYKMGKLPATRKSAEKRMSKVPKRLNRAERMKVLIVAKDIYHAMVNSLQAVIVYMGEEVPAPKQLAKVAREELVSRDLLEEKYVEQYEEVYSLYKDVEHNDMDELSGEEVDEYIEMGKEFVTEMQKLMKKIELNRKARKIQSNYESMVKTSVAALKGLGELPEDPKDLPKAFKEVLIERELVDERYEKTFGKVLEMKKKLNEKEIEDITEHQINVAKDFVKGFMRDVHQLMDERGIEPGEVEEKMEPDETPSAEKIEKEVEGEEEKVECDECGKEFDSERGLKIHRSQVHES
ncbi:MAG: nucleotidyltransferase domain-containing protein [Candidatus Aenigmatarchaeota archaeon]